MYPLLKEKKGVTLYFKKEVKTFWNASYKSITLILYHKTHVLDQIPLSTTNAVDYCVLAIHESKAHFLSQDTSSEGCVITIFYSFSLKISTDLRLP
jgi:hypothetical protein